jgi:hypothetical protein
MFPERAQVRFKFLYKNLLLTGFFFFWSLQVYPEGAVQPE